MKSNLQKCKKKITCLKKVETSLLELTFDLWNITKPKELFSFNVKGDITFKPWVFSESLQSLHAIVQIRFLKKMHSKEFVSHSFVCVVNQIKPRKKYLN